MLVCKPDNCPMCRSTRMLTVYDTWQPEHVIAESTGHICIECGQFWYSKVAYKPVFPLTVAYHEIPEEGD